MSVTDVTESAATDTSSDDALSSSLINLYESALAQVTERLRLESPRLDPSQVLSAIQHATVQHLLDAFKVDLSAADADVGLPLRLLLLVVLGLLMLLIPPPPM